MRYWLNRVLFSVVVGIAMPCMACDEATNPQPNIVVVFIDDMGWSDLSCFGGEVTQTESIDRLAHEGLRFTNFYVNSPICSPSRVALTTGQYPQRWRISSFLSNRHSNRRRGMAQWLDPRAPSLPRELQQAGYATGHFGKWHMGGQRDVGDAPMITEYGFDASLTNFEGLGPRVLPLKDAYDGSPAKPHDLGSAKLGRGPIRWEDRSGVTAAFVNEAVRFIDKSAARNQPFYVNLWPDDVHSPFFPPERLRAKTDGSKRALYYAVLDAMDAQLGKLFDRIRHDRSLRDNTLIFVMSDNGHEEGAGASDPLRGSKTWLYEGGVRSPLIVWGPGWIDRDLWGTTNETSNLCALDLNRSLYTLAGIEIPKNVILDGEDLHATLLGKDKSTRTNPIFWRRPPDRPGNAMDKNPDLAVREGKWKLYADYDGSRKQLYDLDVDVSESNDVREENADVVQRLHVALVAWNDLMPRDAGDPNWQTDSETNSVELSKFVNPIAEGADPWVVRDPKGERFLWCMSEGNRAITVHSSQRLTSLGEKHVVWQAPDTGMVSREVWAPELHFLDGHWHIYFAASNGENKNHRAYVLKSVTGDPLGEYKLHGPLATGDGDDGLSPNLWAIDMTVLDLAGRRYALWSGWDAPGTDQQFLYIATMKSPTELSGPRVRLCANDDYLWERTQMSEDKRGLNEAPQVFQAGDNTFVVYSCGASWLPTYKLGLLKLVGDDPLDPASWEKRSTPVFQGTDDTYGIGHSCFIQSLDAAEWWHVFHAKLDRNPGWRRAVFVQPMRTGADGQPQFGAPLARGSVIDRPAGEILPAVSLPFSTSLRDADLAAWSYYGHHQFFAAAPDGLHLGMIPAEPINDFRCGEKVVLDRRLPDDHSIDVSIDFRRNNTARDAGILFRCTGSSVGYDAQRGYFAGLIPRTGLVILGKMNGDRWFELARAPTEIDTSAPQRLRVEVAGTEISVFHDGEKKLLLSDDTYKSGFAGLRVVDTHVVFADVLIDSH